MKKLPKLLFVPIIAVTAALFFSFSGCGSIGAFYALKDAYDKGYVTVEDLESIAAVSYTHLTLPTNSRA